METLYDFIHGYQPAYEFKEWFLDNLRDVFLPTSEAMAKGLIKHNVQLQGWTIDLGLNSENVKVRLYTKKIIENLKNAFSEKNISLGFSAYSHAILPFCSDILCYAQMKIDFDTVKKEIGKPDWFFFPEGACDKRTFEILMHGFPKTKALVPDKCFSKEDILSENVKITSEYTEIYAIIYNVLVKDILMGANYSDKKSSYAPEKLEWKLAQKSMKQAKPMMYTLSVLNKAAPKIIVRDWENGDSKNCLKRILPKIKDISSFIEAQDKNIARFELIGDIAKARKKISIEKINPGSWEPISTKDNPYPYWNPSKDTRKKLTPEKIFLLDGWLKIVESYNTLFDSIVIDFCLKKNIIKKENSERLTLDEKIKITDIALKDKEILELFKTTSPALISCFPWHFTTPEQWDNDVGLSLDILQKNIRPNMKKIIYFHEYHVSLFKDKENFMKLLEEMETSLQYIIDKIIKDHDKSSY